MSYKEFNISHAWVLFGCFFSVVGSIITENLDKEENHKEENENPP